MTNAHLKLGKLAPKIDKRTLKFRDYLKAPKEVVIPYPTPKQDYISKVPSFPLYGNDILGDCVEAASGHMIQMWDAYANPSKPIPTRAQIVSAYSAITGYIPGDPSTDNGTVILDALNYWKSNGIAGRKIVGYAALNPGDLIELRQAVELFGCAMIGVQLPVTAQDQEAWTVKSTTGDGSPGTWGGHCLPVGAYDYTTPDKIRNEIVTWGQTMLMSNNFYKEYSDEAYVVFSEEFMEPSGLSASGFDLAALEADLAAL